MRTHLRHVRELLKSLDITDGYNGVEGSSPSFLSYFVEDRMEGKMQTEGTPYNSLLYKLSIIFIYRSINSNKMSIKCYMLNNLFESDIHFIS